MPGSTDWRLASSTRPPYFGAEVAKAPESAEAARKREENPTMMSIYDAAASVDDKADKVE